MSFTLDNVTYYIIVPIFCVLLGAFIMWIIKRPAPCMKCQVREALTAPETITGTVIYNGQTFFLPVLLQRPNGVMMNGLTENIEQANLQN
uniref:Uncharacterized protein n=1 Tax=Acrobeloides nanus TaxID=290746 RepID=A0A914DB39_9BILA